VKKEDLRIEDKKAYIRALSSQVLNLFIAEVDSV
jgi:hypothetical protein